MNERRRIFRWKINRPAKVKLEGAEECAQCQVKDINLKGLQVCLKPKLPVDSFLKLCLFLADDCSLNIEAWVVWHKAILEENNYGLYFSRIKDEDKDKIYKFVHRYCPQEIKRQYCQDTVKEGGEVMPRPSFEDKRIFERFPVRLPLRFLDLNANKEGEAQTQDVSAKGISFVTNESLQANAPLELWLNIPDKGEPLYARGEVVWSGMVSPNEHRIGVKLEKADLMGLSRVLRAR